MTNRIETLNQIAEQHIAEGPAIKTYASWKGDLNEYLEAGDYVDEEMVQYFINTLPPVTFRSDHIQFGEPYSHIKGYPTFATLEKDERGWRYCGNCYRGDIYEPEE